MLVTYQSINYNPELVLFFCSFLALRSEDTSNNLTAISDSVLHNEKELFGGCVDSNTQRS